MTRLWNAYKIFGFLVLYCDYYFYILVYSTRTMFQDLMINYSKIYICSWFFKYISSNFTLRGKFICFSFLVIKKIIYKVYEKTDDVVFYISEYNTLNSAGMYACSVIDCLKYKDTYT